MSEYVSQREFARRVNRSHVWVNRLVREGRLPANDQGQIPLTAGLEAFEHSQPAGGDGRTEYMDRQREKRAAKKAAAKKAAKKSPAKKAAAKKSAPEPETEIPATAEGMSVARVNEAFNRARLAEKTYQAKLKELEFKEASGQLIPVEDVQADAAHTGAEVRQRLLAVPTRVAGICEGKTAREIERIIDEAINEALTALNRARFNKK